MTTPEETGPWRVGLHASGKYKVLTSDLEDGNYYFQHPESTVIDAVCGRLNALEAEVETLRAALRQATAIFRGEMAELPPIDLGRPWASETEDAIYAYEQAHEKAADAWHP